MAKKKKEKAEPKDSEKLRAVHERAIKRFYRSEEADRIQAELAQYDLVFKCGDQWEAREKITRKANGQPCLTLNMMPEKISQVVGDQRQNKPEIKTVSEIRDVIKAVETCLGEEGRVFVRYSGTQPLCRIMVEGPFIDETEKYCRQIADIVEEKLGK